MTDATAKVKSVRPDLKVEGPLQYDAAIDPKVGRGLDQIAECVTVSRSEQGQSGACVCVCVRAHKGGMQYSDHNYRHCRQITAYAWVV